jgi:hypothetical protein
MVFGIILRQTASMAVPMVNLVEFAQVLALLDRIASPAIVDRALCAAGLNRNVLANESGFLPYGLEARVIEQVARTVGDAALGTRIAEQFDYGTDDAYARYVLGARDLGMALERGRRAFPLMHPGSHILLRRQEGHVLVGRKAELARLVGHRHLDDGAILIIGGVIRHFLGPDWRPEWVETTGKQDIGTSYLQEMIGAPVRTGAESPALVLRESALSTPNSNPSGRAPAGEFHRATVADAGGPAGNDGRGSRAGVAYPVCARGPLRRQRGSSSLVREAHIATLAAG